MFIVTSCKGRGMSLDILHTLHQQKVYVYPRHQTSWLVTKLKRTRALRTSHLDLKQSMPMYFLKPTHNVRSPAPNLRKRT
uniref:Uncharacterized protein n=1 Tax=Arundo donax TaxID=35708 RepID=A0A0A9DNP6_ARUDO